MTLGEKLQKLRRARAWTQEQLAERIGVSRQSLSKWESDGALPDTANIIALADLFGVTTDYLLRDDAAAASPAPQTSDAPAQPVAPTRPAWPLSLRELGARLMVASAGIGLVVLRACASLSPAEASIDDRHYTGFAGFLQFHDLWWALWLMLAVLAAGLAQWFGPWLMQQGKRLLAFLKPEREQAEE